MGLIATVIQNRVLLFELTKRDVLQRYRGTSLGLTWTIVNPILMLAIYTLVFSEVFKVRWGDVTQSKFEFSLILFLGLMIFNFFSECVNRAPRLILEHAHYITKLPFPVDLLPVVLSLSSLFHLLINTIVWIVFYMLVIELPSPSLVLFFLPITSVFFLALGLSFLLASLGVFFRDVVNVVAVITSGLLFMTPIFYPLEIIPLPYREWALLNPLAIVIEMSRNIMYFGSPISLGLWVSTTAVGIIITWLSYIFFKRTQTMFADVL